MTITEENLIIFYLYMIIDLGLLKKKKDNPFKDIHVIERSLSDRDILFTLVRMSLTLLALFIIPLILYYLYS